MQPDTEYDPVLHVVARTTARGIMIHAKESPDGESRPSVSELLLAQMYLDLLERRGLPLSFKPGTASIQLVDGTFFDFVKPEATPVSPEVIASSTSKISRCAGHTLGDLGYSVAQHMCHASDMAPPALKFKALMHDAHEGIVGDMPTPLKLLCPDFKIVEKRVLNVIALQYRLPRDFDHEVKEIDLRMAATEKRDIMPPGVWEMLGDIKPYDNLEIELWSSRKARSEWLWRFEHLYAAHKEIV